MFTRLAIHLSNEAVVCLPWRFGRPLAEVRFDASETGFAALTRFLAGWQNVPTRVAVDLVEEDFRIETLPHLRGSDRRVVLQRRLSQLYRGTPFRMATLQGREASGRRDDIALCTAITQGDILVRCLDALAHWRIPVLGVYPAALLGEPLLRALRIATEQLMLVTLVSEDALRISFFQNGQLKFSRISQPTPDAEGGISAELRDEMRRTLQYVGSQAWFHRSGVPVQTLLLADSHDAERLAAIWQETDVPLQVLPPAAIARRLRLPALEDRSSPIGVMLYLLMQQPAGEQLAPRERTRDGRLWYVRTAMFALSSMIATAAAAVAVLDVVGGLQVRDENVLLAAQLVERRAQITEAQARLPASSLSPDRMSALVHFEHNEVAALPRLLPFLQALSQAMDAQPTLLLRRISWASSTRPPTLREVRPVGSGGGRDDAAVLSGLQARRFYEDMRIDGEVVTPDATKLRDPAPAVAAVEQLAASLRTGGRQVQVIRPPYDLDPGHALGSGSLEARGRNPEFTLRVIAGGSP